MIKETLTCINEESCEISLSMLVFKNPTNVDRSMSAVNNSRRLFCDSVPKWYGIICLTTMLKKHTAI
jgi:hypothetical protein